MKKIILVSAALGASVLLSGCHHTAHHAGVAHHGCATGVVGCARTQAVHIPAVVTPVRPVITQSAYPRTYDTYCSPRRYGYN